MKCAAKGTCTDFPPENHTWKLLSQDMVSDEPSTTDSLRTRSVFGSGPDVSLHFSPLSLAKYTTNKVIHSAKVGSKGTKTAHNAICHYRDNRARKKVLSIPRVQQMFEGLKGLIKQPKDVLNTNLNPLELVQQPAENRQQTGQHIELQKITTCPSKLGLSVTSLAALEEYHDPIKRCLGSPRLTEVKREQKTAIKRSREGQDQSLNAGGVTFEQQCTSCYKRHNKQYKRSLILIISIIKQIQKPLMKS